MRVSLKPWAPALLLAGLIAGGWAMAAGTPEALRGELRIPATEPSFAGRQVEIRLFSRDPNVMDRPAEVVGSLDIAGLAHLTGEATTRPFKLPLNRPYDPDQRYYATFYLLDQGTRTHIGECAHAPNNSCGVFTATAPAEVIVSFRALR